LTRTSTIFTPCSCAIEPAFSAATCAANGVLLREPRKAATARSRPRERVALAIGDRDDRVVERRVHVRDRVRDVLLDLLAAGLGTATGGLALLLLLLISHSSSAKPLCLTGRARSS
jgi:hypothetical protein